MLSADCGVRPLTAPEPQHRAQWTEMRGQNLRRRAFWCKSAVWAVVFAVIIVAAMLLGPGH
jgi:hypothetical protein